MNNKFLKLLDKEYDLSCLIGLSKDEVAKNKQPTLLNFFEAIDANSDGVLTNSEVSIFQNVFESVDNDGNGEINKKELKRLLKTDSEFIKKLLATGKVKLTTLVDLISALTKVGNNATASTILANEYEVTSRTVEEVQELAIDTILDEVDRGYSILNEHENGVISQSYDTLKEFFGSKMSESAVAKNLFIKNETAELLRRAKNGTLTKSEYYRIIKENLFQTIPGIENASPEQQQNIADRINSLAPEDIERFQKQILALPSPDSSDYEASVRTFAEYFMMQTHTITTENYQYVQDSIQFSNSSIEYQVNKPYSLEGANELMTFEELYCIRNGVEFDQQKVENYEVLSSQFAIQQSYIEIYTYIHGMLDNTESGSKIENSVLEILKSLLQSEDEQVLSDTLCRMTGMLGIKVQDGKIVGDLQAIKQAVLNRIDDQWAEISGGKSFEELSADIEKAYTEAYGKENVELLAKAYVQEQEKFVKYARTSVELVSGAAAIVGMFCCPPLAIGAGLVGSFGGVGLELIEEVSKENSSDANIERLKKELAMNAALFAAGMGTGVVSSGVSKIAQVATKCPTLVAMVAERGVDTTLSLISTMAITGELDLQGVGISQVLAVVAGLKSAKVGIKNASAEPEVLGIVPWRNNRSGGLLRKFFGSADIDPNSRLNRYKPSSNNHNLSHTEFYCRNPELFKGTHLYDCWATLSSTDPHHGPWKMHLFSISEGDWQKMSDVIIPYLRDNDIEWKTFNAANNAECLNSSIQQGKAFTIYPRDNKHFEQIARDLDYIIRNNNLEISGSQIAGDRHLGNTGRIFYRYEYKSGQYKDVILNLNSKKDWDTFNSLYDANADRAQRLGQSYYLPEDMNPQFDDPWFNFDPSVKANNQVVRPQSSPVSNPIRANSPQFDMVKGQYYQANTTSVLHLPNGVVIDFNDSHIKSIVNSVPDNTPISVGRDINCTIRIKDECLGVSRVHLYIYKLNGQIYLQDVSSNGTKLTL